MTVSVGMTGTGISPTTGLVLLLEGKVRETG